MPAAAPVQAQPAAYGRQQAVEEVGARSKFGNAKSISSDMYFERGAHAPMDAEASMRLNQFAGQQSISSAQFYGRDEEDMMQRRAAGNVAMGDVLDNAEVIAKDFARTFISQAKDDIQTVSQVAQVGAAKLQDFIRDLQTRY